LGFRAAASYWKRDNSTTVYLSPGIRRSFGRLQSELSYQRYLTKRSSQTVVSEALELSLTFPIARKLFYTLQGRGQWGDALDSNSLYTGIWLSF
jgi:outer membrane usher protein FimD/PapC